MPECEHQHYDKRFLMGRVKVEGPSLGDAFVDERSQGSLAHIICLLRENTIHVRKHVSFEIIRERQRRPSHIQQVTQGLVYVFSTRTRDFVKIIEGSFVNLLRLLHLVAGST